MGTTLASGARDLAISGGNGEKSDGKDGLFRQKSEMRGGIAESGWRDGRKRRKVFVIAIMLVCTCNRKAGCSLLVNVFDCLLGSEPTGANEAESGPCLDGVGIGGVRGQIGGVVLDLGRASRGGRLARQFADGGLASVRKPERIRVGCRGGRGGSGSTSGRDNAAIASMIF